MSLLLIVLLLDESHLGLIEDVLKEINFNDKDWSKLEKELGLQDERLEYIYIENSLNLKECLKEWLSPDITRYRLQILHHVPPTLYDLAAALKRIGYREAGEYITKTCKLIIMFNDQCY